MNLGLEFGADADQGGTHAHQSATLTDIGRSDPAFGQEVGSEQVSQCLGIDRVVLDSRR